MKQILLKSLAFLAVLMIFNCENDVLDIDSANTVNSEIEQRHVHLVDWTPPNPCEMNNIQIYIPDDCPDYWRNAVLAAMDQYNSLNESQINYSPTNIPEHADTEIVCRDFGEFNPLLGYNPSLTVGSNSFASPRENGLLNDQIDFRTNIDEHPSLGDCELTECWYTYIAMHEMAHALGFHHNDLGSLCPSDNTNGFTYGHVEGTPEPHTFDPNSILNGFNADCDQDACVFNDNDLIAMDVIYGGVINFDSYRVLCSREPNDAVTISPQEGYYFDSNEVIWTMEPSDFSEVISQRVTKGGVAGVTINAKGDYEGPARLCYEVQLECGPYKQCTDVEFVNCNEQ